MKATDIVVTRWGARFMGRRFPCAIGKGGITSDKREGDGASPRGIHHLPRLYYRADRIPALTAEKIRVGDLWCDAGDHPSYNHLVHAPFSASHEKMRRADRLYDLVLITDWNWPDATPGKGSAIFVHRWRKPRHPTEGCVAFRADHLRWIAERVTPATRLIIR
ncbi:L,D-transpeptidase family protein [Celeribacter litoreus]|uniref:L,D-transpeptidase family protein n=1 Tax=Celeribacter litoreus TaxID=2876714 RepID=UPI001CCB97A1|nr:L,D-transpeptidase family protein [Celeribacter litoreus]MCA0041924.1 L,D-transpeptidase family protein [Celeribacter litoreus]